MKPSKLRCGQKVKIVSNVNGKTRDAIVVELGQRGGNSFVFEVPDYAGLDGPDDKGLCTMRHHEVVQRVVSA